MPQKTRTSIFAEPNQATGTTENAPKKYPRKPTAKQLAQFIAEILAEDKKPKRSTSTRAWSSTKAKQTKPSILAVSSEIPQHRVHRIRPSLYDYVKTDLGNKGLTTCYNQRVYIVGRNIPIEIEDMPIEDQSTVAPSMEKSNSTAPLVFTMQLRKPKHKVKLEPVQQPAETVGPNENVETFISKTVMRQDFSEGSDVTTRTSVDYSVDTEEGFEEDFDVDPETDPALSSDYRDSLNKANFLMSFREKILQIKLLSERALSDDKLGGLLLCMDDYSLMVVEGTEDIVTEFLKGLQKCVNDFWCENRVFYIEDMPDKCLFSPMFYSYRTAAIYLNEKFPNSTPRNPFLMRRQHNKLYEKIQEVIHTLANDDTPLVRYVLPSERYYRLLPEVQRLDLVLRSTRFYCTLDKYLGLFDIMISRNDDYALTWPHPYNYTPTHSLRYTPYDVNLTYPSSGESDTVQQGRRSDESALTGQDVDGSSEDQKQQNEVEWVDQEGEEEEEHQPDFEESVGYSQDTETIATSHDSDERFFGQPLEGIDSIHLQVESPVQMGKRLVTPLEQIRWAIDRDMLDEKRDPLLVDLTKGSRHRGFGGFRGRISYRNRLSSKRRSTFHSRGTITTTSNVSQQYEKEEDLESDLAKYIKRKQKLSSANSTHSSHSIQSNRSRSLRRGSRTQETASSPVRRASTASQSSVRSGSRPRSSSMGKK